MEDEDDRKVFSSLSSTRDGRLEDVRIAGLLEVAEEVAVVVFLALFVVVVVVVVNPGLRFLLCL